jgi:hypothetical protein
MRFPNKLPLFFVFFCRFCTLSSIIHQSSSTRKTFTHSQLNKKVEDGGKINKLKFCIHVIRAQRTLFILSQQPDKVKKD